MTAQPVPYIDRSRRYYEAQGFEKPYAWAHFDDTPFTPLVKPVAESRLALFTTAALYDRQAGDPRFVTSAETADPPERLYGNDLSWDRRATHLDDLDSYFPVDRLKELIDAGRLGGLTPRFHCVPTEYSHRRTMTNDAPEVLDRCREDGADIALFVPL